ncbi:ribonuclease H-like domain-containing protein [Tanacetum coccineum]
MVDLPIRPWLIYHMARGPLVLNGCIETRKMIEMDVKSAFLYGTIEEEVYVCQPPRFEDPQFLDKVYKVHQAPRAWYETLSTYLLENGFRRGTIDKTLFIKKEKDDAQEIQMSSIGELTFFLRLPVKSMIGSLMYLTAFRPDIMFVVYACAWFQVTPKVLHLHVVKRIFRYLKGQPKLGLWYPRDSPFDLEALRIFRYLRSVYAGASLDRNSTTRRVCFAAKLLWTGVVDPKSMLFMGFNFMITEILIALIEGRMIAMDWRCFLDEVKVNTGISKISTDRIGKAVWLDLTATVRTVDNGKQEITATVDGKEFTLTEASVRRHLQLANVDAEEGEGSGHPFEPQLPPSTAQPIHEEPIPNIVSSSHQKTETPRQALNQVTELPQTSEPIPNVPDEAVYEEWDDRVKRATTTTASLDTAHASGNITKTQSMVIPNVPLPQGIGTGGSPRCQEATRGAIAQTRSKRVPTQPHDSPLPRVNILGSDEGSMQLQELMALCTKLLDSVLAFETDLRQTKKVYGVAYTKLIMKVKKLENTVNSNRARRRAKIVVSDDEEDLEDSSKQGRMIEEIDQDAGVTLVTLTHSQEDQPEDYTGSGGVSTASRLFSTAEELVCTAGVLMPVSTAGMLDEEERQRIARVHEEARSFNIEEWEDIQATIEADES